MRRAPLSTAALVILMAGALPLAAQTAPRTDTLRFDPVGRFRLEIQSPPPRGDWSALLTVTATSGQYTATFANPDGPGGYPVASITARDSSLTFTLGGEAAGAVYSLTVKGNSLAGFMTSVNSAYTPVHGRRLKN
jgi:hypothetical protein